MGDLAATVVVGTLVYGLDVHRLNLFLGSGERGRTPRDARVGPTGIPHPRRPLFN